MENKKPLSLSLSLPFYFTVHPLAQLFVAADQSLQLKDPTDGKREDRDQADRELDESAGNLLEAPQRDHEEGERDQRPLLPKILERYQQNCGKKLWDAKHENLNAQIDRIKKENDNMQIELRHLKGEDLNSLNPMELIPIEEALTNGVNGVRQKQSEFLKTLKKNERLLEEENKRLTYILNHQQFAMEGNAREMDLVYHQKAREFAAQMPMTFRVQPIQPNLHENK